MKDWMKMVQDHVLTSMVEYEGDRCTAIIKPAYADYRKTVASTSWENVYAELNEDKARLVEKLNKKLAVLNNPDDRYREMLSYNPGVKYTYDFADIKEAVMNLYGYNVCNKAHIAGKSWEEVHEEAVKVEEDMKYKEKVEDMYMVDSIVHSFAEEHEGLPSVRLKGYIKTETWESMWNKLQYLLEEDIKDG